jgi:Domain of unknown function (DUF6933)
MPAIMCTKHLWQLIGGRATLRARPRAEIRGTRLGAWCVRELQTPSGPLAVALEETTYLTVVCPLLTLPDFLIAFASSTAVALQDLGVASRDAAPEAAAIVSGARFAKNDNRSLLGSVNDVAFHVLVRLEGERRLTADVLENVQRELNRMPHVNREPSFPDQAVRLLFREASSA